MNERRHDRFVIPSAHPAYLDPAVRAALPYRAATAREALRCCTACPRECRVNRLADERKFCRTGRLARVSSAFAHHGEETCLRGRRGSGTIFFAGCNLHCVFCQNWDISQRTGGEELDAEAIAALMLELQARGCHNINLVTPEHVVPQTVEALAAAIERGLALPVVYNTSAYDSVASLRLLDGLVDIYMPDFKFWRGETARRLSRAEDYPERAREAIREMHRQVGDLRFTPDGVACRGLLVRHLVMPGQTDQSAAIFRWLAEETSPDTFVNIMGQYHPANKVGTFGGEDDFDNEQAASGGVAGDTEGAAKPGKTSPTPRYADINRRPTRAELAAAYAAAEAAGLWRFD